MTEISSVVNVTVNVADSQISREGFGTPLILVVAESTVFAARTKSYTTLLGVAADFAETTKAYKAAAAIFAQSRTPLTIKIGRRETGDANITAALNAIVAEDNEWYGLVSTYRLSADLQEIALWTETAGKIYGACSQDADVLTNVSTDVASILQAAAYNRTFYMWHHKGGADVTGASYTITSGIATITQASHGLSVGDPVTFDTSSGASIDGNNTVATVPTSGTYTVLTTAIDEAGPATVNYFANYLFPEVAWTGYMLPSDPGSETWKFKELTGQTPVPSTAMNPSEELEALSHGANLYTALGGVGHTHDGIMTGGRFIDIQRGIDWLDARIEEGIATLLLNVAKVPYTDAGAASFHAEIASVLDLGVRNGLLGPLLDDSGDFYNILIPKVADQSTTDRQSRYFPGITAQAQLAGAVHSLVITVNAQI